MACVYLDRALLNVERPKLQIHSTVGFEFRGRHLMIPAHSCACWLKEITRVGKIPRHSIRWIDLIRFVWNLPTGPFHLDKRVCLFSRNDRQYSTRRCCRQSNQASKPNWQWADDAVIKPIIGHAWYSSSCLVWLNSKFWDVISLLVPGKFAVGPIHLQPCVGC